MRAGAVTAAATLMMLMSSPAFAQEVADGSYKGLSVAQTLGLYVAIPLVAFAVIAGLVMVGSKSTVTKNKKK